jgi:hypothetical protein
MSRIPARSALVLALALGGCSGHAEHPGGAEPIEVSIVGPASPLPPSYKSDILAMLRVYVADPTNIRHAAVSGVLPVTGRGRRRQMVCLRFDAKTGSGQYSGVGERIALFSNGRLDQMAEAGLNQCAGAVFEPFPEAERLTR